MPADANEAVWPQRGDGDPAGRGGRGDNNGERSVLSGDPPKREPRPLGDHEAVAGQGEGTVSQARWCRVYEQPVDPGGPGGAEPGNHQQAQGQAEARAGGECRQVREYQQAGRDDDAPLNRIPISRKPAARAGWPMWAA